MKSVLNYFVRKAFGFKSTATAEDKTLFGHLLRIRQNIQGVYDWLYGRLSAEHLPRRMPMTEAVTSADGSSGSTPVKLRPVLQNSDNLLAHLRLLDGRKITNGYADGTPADDGLPDGVSLARILCDSTTQPTELIDDNIGWVMDKPITLSAKKAVVNCVRVKQNVQILPRSSTIEEIEMPYLEKIDYNEFCVTNIERIMLPSLKRIDYLYNSTGAVGSTNIFSNSSKIKSIHFPILEYLAIGNFNWSFCRNNSNLEEVLMPSIKTLNCSHDGNSLYNCANLGKVVLGVLESFTTSTTQKVFGLCPNLLHLEIGEGTKASLNFAYWSPTLSSDNLEQFLSNFLHFIAERVAEGNYTLTLSAAVFSSIWDADGNPAVIGDGHDELRAAINTELRYNKHWNVNKA